MADDDYLDALAHYRTLFPTLASLGTGAAAWSEEVARVASGALAAVLATGADIEGGSISGIANFNQRARLRALHARRAEVDSLYTNPYAMPVSRAMAPMPGGFRVRLGL
jgi:hypothetical protein